MHGTASPDLHDVLDQVCDRIAPVWPLDRFIAVNPLWGFVDRPMPTASAEVGALSGARLTMPRAWYRERWTEGRFDEEDLDIALATLGAGLPRERVLEALEAAVDPQLPRRARITDLLDAQADPAGELSPSQVVREDLSRHCAAWFDRGQALLRPARAQGFYGAWRARLVADPSAPLLLGMPLPAVTQLPIAANDVFPLALDALGVPPDQREAYLVALLQDILGWASWCAFRRFSARLEGSDDDSLIELLAARLAWEWVLWSSAAERLAQAWERAVRQWPTISDQVAEQQVVDWVLQDAFERGYHRALARSLEQAAPPVEVETRVQAAFCIDVRSEVLRRALEAESGQVHTLGFAGFFGLPAEYRAIGATRGIAQLPGLLRPQLRVTDTGLPGETAAARQQRLRLSAAWKGFRYAALSGFSFVEAVGLLYGPKLLSDALGLTRPFADPHRAGLSESAHRLRKPRLTETVDGEPLSVAQRADLAAGILRNMSLTRGFARLVALVGHGSRSVNNPHASGLDCGACCGQSGEVNARAVCALLNETAVREALHARGIAIPASTWFVPALHDTTTEEVTLFDLDEAPVTHREDLATLRRWLDGASERTRRERASRAGQSSHKEAFEARARDWSQVRPEWGLAGNAAFVVAPRSRTQGLDLEGRAFLHEYRWDEDVDGAVLEGILTAPMVVTHWINLQYYASTTDNLRFGSGNKVLHNVVGGGIGVLEGTGGDLRTGLALQSLHDGERFVHEPLRLGVFVEAPRDRVATLVARHETVRRLVAHEWLHLFVLDPLTGRCERLKA
ncbi:MAG: DUF2309 domain-containing protein [Deltaproteobacteria bacterium]|nr:MAG: DUF2309 domain-containing protein [Deltaproteobacteria bacterium]